MPLNEKLPDWKNTGFEPSETKKTEGFKELEKPPAGWFNWFFNRTYKVLAELREEVFLKEDAEGFATKDSLDTHIGAIATEVSTIKQNVESHAADNVRHITSGERTTWNNKQSALPIENRRKITFGTANPTGGADGDIYFQYE